MRLLRLDRAVGRAGCDGVVGAAFLSFLEKDAKPFGHENNLVMLYVVGPDGRGAIGSKGAFLGQVQRTARNALELVMQHNEIAEETGGETVEIVRWCLVSGGDLFRHPEATKRDVARSTLLGVREAVDWGLRLRHPPPSLDFIWDQDAFALAHTQLLAEPRPG